MKREANSLAIGVREILLHQFGNQLKGILEQTKCKGMLYDEINRLLMSLEEEEWIQGWYLIYNIVAKISSEKFCLIIKKLFKILF